MAMGETYVSRGSTKENLSISILIKPCLERTMRRSLHSVHSKGCHDSSQDPEERATVECPFVTGHLQGSSSLVANMDGVRE
jgi:hypothetical protein